MTDLIHPHDSSLVDDLIARGKLMRVDADPSLAYVHVERAHGRLRSAQRALDADDLGECASPLWDAARMSCAAILQAEGLRPHGEGHHVTTIDAVSEQYGHLLGGLLRTVRRLRVERRDDEYPTSSMSPELNRQDIADDIDSVTQLLAAVEKMLPLVPVFP